MLSASLSNYAEQVIVTMSMNVSFVTEPRPLPPVPTSCALSSVFDAASVALLNSGGAASCTWQSRTVVVVNLPAGNTLVGGEQVTVLGGVLSRTDDTSGAFTASQTTLTVAPRLAAPSALAAQMTSSGNSIVVTFNGPSSGWLFASSGAVPCSLVLANGNLGQNAQCRWQSLTSLLVTLGFAVDANSLLFPVVASSVRDPAFTVVDCAAAAPSSTLTIMANVISAVPNGIAKNPAQCVVVLQPSVAIAPVVSISGALSLGACDDLVLDGTGTVDTTGRYLAFHWAVAALNSDAMGAVPDLLANDTYPGVTQPVLTVPAALLQPGSRFQFTLTATNFLGGVASLSTTVTVAAQALPRVTIDGPAVRYTTVALTTALSAIGSQTTASCGNITVVQQVRVPLIVGCWSRKTPRRLCCPSCR